MTSRKTAVYTTRYV